MGNILDDDKRLPHERSDDPLEYSKDWSDSNYLFYRFRYVQPKNNKPARDLHNRMVKLRNLDRSMENAHNNLRRFDSEVFEGYNEEMKKHLVQVRLHIKHLRRVLREEAEQLDSLYRLSCSE